MQWNTRSSNLCNVSNNLLMTPSILVWLNRQIQRSTGSSNVRGKVARGEWTVAWLITFELLGCSVNYVCFLGYESPLHLFGPYYTNFGSRKTLQTSVHSFFFSLLLFSICYIIIVQVSLNPVYMLIGKFCKILKLNSVSFCYENHICFLIFNTWFMIFHNCFLFYFTKKR